MSEISYEAIQAKVKSLKANVTKAKDVVQVERGKLFDYLLSQGYELASTGDQISGDFCTYWIHPDYYGQWLENPNEFLYPTWAVVDGTYL